MDESALQAPFQVFAAVCFRSGKIAIFVSCNNLYPTEKPANAFPVCFGPCIAWYPNKRTKKTLKCVASANEASNNADIARRSAKVFAFGRVDHRDVWSCGWISRSRTSATRRGKILTTRRGTRLLIRTREFGGWRVRHDSPGRQRFDCLQISLALGSSGRFWRI